MEIHHGEDSQIMAPPNLVKLSTFTPVKPPGSRRLSSHFLNPHSLIPIQSAPRRPLAWVSLQGRLVGAEEASSAKTVGLSDLTAGEVLAWELFSPIHRILIVAVVAVATANSEKNRQIHRLQKCVQLRDEILAKMQEKVDCLCEQVSVMKDRSEPATALAISQCWLCDQHRVQLDDLKENAKSEVPEMFKCKMPFPSDAEPEERRMSDLSDWNCSVTSSLDIQLENLAIEQDVYNLKRECEEKETTIKELSEFIVSKDAASLKASIKLSILCYIAKYIKPFILLKLYVLKYIAKQRVQELEDIVRQKSVIITKLRKDMAVLEQKVMQLTRLKRRSFPGQVMQSLEIPAMRDNLLYDMDSTTSPSSSDSDCSAGRKKSSNVETKEKQAVVPPQDPTTQTDFTHLPTPTGIQHSASAKMSSAKENARLKPVSLLQEKSKNQSSSVYISRTLSTSGDSKSRRRAKAGVNVPSSSLKRWV
ncbi:hypothetical protein V2J09_022662 [Rumex salicifolius]